MWKKEVQVVVYTCILVWGCNVMHQCTFTWVRWLKKLIDRSCLNSKAPTNSQIFDYLFVNLLFDEENRSQIFGGRVSHWLTIMPACSQHRMGSESRWLKTSSCSCHSAQGGSQFKRKVLETLAKFGELLNSLTTRMEGDDSSGLTMDWPPARCRRCRNPAADIGVTRTSTNSWKTTIRDTDTARWGFGGETFHTTTRVR